MFLLAIKITQTFDKEDKKTIRSLACYFPSEWGWGGLGLLLCKDITHTRTAVLAACSTHQSRQVEHGSAWFAVVYHLTFRLGL